MVEMATGRGRDYRTNVTRCQMVRWCPPCPRSEQDVIGCVRVTLRQCGVESGRVWGKAAGRRQMLARHVWPWN